MIITGGIDLSIGSVVGLVAVVLAFCLKIQGLDPWLSIGLTLGLSLLIGLVHGLLVTKAGIQPFVVTLCGLLVYRSLGHGFLENLISDYPKQDHHSQNTKLQVCGNSDHIDRVIYQSDNSCRNHDSKYRSFTSP